MPIGIGVQGGSTSEVARRNISRLTDQQAFDRLQKIKTHLSQPGRDSGVLTLFNRTNESEMTLERKSDFQLLFRTTERLDDTVHAVKEMLKKAGLDEAVVDLDRYLSSREEGKQNRIESSKMSEILNRHLPAPGQGSSLERLYKLQDIKKVQELGSGGFGSAYLVDVSGEESVLKEFKEPETLSLKRTSRPNEAMGSYLTSKKHPNYLVNKVNISQPTSYLISVMDRGERLYQIVHPHRMRSLVKKGEQTGAEIRCYGLVMAKAKGTEGAKLISERTLTQPEEKIQYIRSTLESIKGLNERGFVHRDIKPANSYFDEQSGNTTLIDTGSLYKTSKKDSDTDYIHRHRFGTPAFMHPRAAHGLDHGTETDLYALGVMALQVDHPDAFKRLLPQIVKQNFNSDGITHDWLSRQLGREIERAKSPDLRDKLTALRRDIGEPTTLSGFAMQCFTMAGIDAKVWKDRAKAQQAYSQLLDHLDHVQ
jgi:serine/threonine protein kinase